MLSLKVPIALPDLMIQLYTKAYLCFPTTQSAFMQDGTFP